MKVNSKKIFEKYGRHINTLKLVNSDQSLLIRLDNSQENYISDVLKFEMTKSKIIGNNLLIYLINQEKKEIKLDNCEIFLTSNENFYEIVKNNIVSENNSNFIWGLIGAVLIFIFLFAIYKFYQTVMKFC